jgi:hypothetical protein
MSEIKRYYTSGIQLNLGKSRILLTEDLVGQLCMYEDIAPIIQRNKELEAEIKRLQEHVDSPTCGVSRDEIMRVNIHTDRAVFNATYDALINSTLTKQKPAQRLTGNENLQDLLRRVDKYAKPAQELPEELVAFANSWQEDDSDMPAYLIGCNDMKHFVKSQLEKMKGGA